MTPFTRLAIRLYPRSWRERYGQEFEALLDDMPSSMRTTFDILKGALRMHLSASGPIRFLVIAAILGTTAGVLPSFLLEKNYASDISIRVFKAPNTRETSPKAAGDYVKKVLDTALNNASLERVVQSLGVRRTTDGTLSPTSAEVKKAMTVTPLEVSNRESRLVVRFVAHDPKLARQIDEDLVETIMEQAVQVGPTMNSPATVTFMVDRRATLVRTGLLHIWTFSLGGAVLGFILALLASVSNKNPRLA